jgi:DeoR family fructose operon transcriptional repressor
VQKIDRVYKIKELLLAHKELSVKDIMKYLNVSEPTARRDISYIVGNNEMYCRIRNGISLFKKGHEAEYLFEEKLGINAIYKKQIAKSAVKFLSDKHTIIIDSGTTCFFFATEIQHRKIQVVTTDLKIAYQLSNTPNIKLHIVGGEVRSGYYSMGGIQASKNLEQFYADILVMSADAFDVSAGVTNIETFEVSIKQTLRKIAKTLILLVDSSKIEKRSFYKIMDAVEIDILITDKNISQEQKKAIQELGIQLEIAE